MTSANPLMRRADRRAQRDTWAYRITVVAFVTVAVFVFSVLATIPNG